MIEYFFITLAASTLFAVIGVGSSLVLIPIFAMTGIDFNFAKAIGLFVNGATTLSFSIHNIKNELLKFQKIYGFILVSIIFSILGAYCSYYIDESIVKTIFTIFIFMSLVFLYKNNYKITTQYQENRFIVSVSISIVAFVGGLIGVGGGAIYLPLFIYAGLTTTKSIMITATLIPFVSFSAFFTYSKMIHINWYMIFVVSLAAIIGGYFGHKIMTKIDNDKYLKIFISVLLTGIAFLMIYTQIFKG